MQLQTTKKMPKFLSFILLSCLILTSCKEDTPVGDDYSDVTDVTALQNRIDQLELTNELKDSVINESLHFFNEIQENLQA